MNDKLYLDNYLLILKSTIEVYIHGTLESSNNDVRKVLNTGLDETLTHQKDTYNLMTKYGFYQIENIKSKTIEQTFNKINSGN